MEHLYVSTYNASSPLEMALGQKRLFSREGDLTFEYLSADDCFIKFILEENDSNNSTTAQTYVSCEPTNYSYAPVIFSKSKDDSEYSLGLYNVIFKIEKINEQEEEVDPNMVCDINDACETVFFNYGFFCHENWHTED